MLKAIAIFLSIILLLQGFSLNAAEFEKMDILLEHAQYHKEKYGDNFTEFIDKHYGDQKDEHSQQHQEEENDHQELPFNHSTPLVLLPIFISNQLTANIPAALFPASQNAHFFYNQLYNSLWVMEILQPPRVG